MRRGYKCGFGRAPVTRLSRKVIVVLALILAVATAAALFLALRPGLKFDRTELYGTDNRTTPDGLSNLPRDYAGLPKNVPPLGPPLPGVVRGAMPPVASRPCVGGRRVLRAPLELLCGWEERA